jgi:large subunit ribosomal protein L29
MTVKEIREKETGHLTDELAERRKHLFDLRSQAVTEKLEDPSQLRKTRKEIAQMKTILRQREIEEQDKAKAAKSAK